MSTKIQKLYLGNYMYFATGEGYHNYLLLVQADNERAAKNTFIDKLFEKRSFDKSDKRARDHFEIGSSVTEIGKVKLGLFAHPYSEIIKNVQELCKKGGMAGGDFELMFRYNLS